MQVLRHMGLVTVQHGVGHFVQRGLRNAEDFELALVRAAPDELAHLRELLDARAAVAAARTVRSGNGAPSIGLDLDVWASERSLMRRSSVESFLRTDHDFHAEITRLGHADSLLVAAAREAIDTRLAPQLVAAAERLALDHVLDERHRNLAHAILLGDVRSATRLGAQIGRRERSTILGSRLRSPEPLP